jgi:hypothetical protein
MVITIIISIHNKERFIEACIKTLLAQNYPSDRYEIIMINIFKFRMLTRIFYRLSRLTFVIYADLLYVIFLAISTNTYKDENVISMNGDMAETQSVL